MSSQIKQQSKQTQKRDFPTVTSSSTDQKTTEPSPKRRKIDPNSTSNNSNNKNNNNNKWQCIQCTLLNEPTASKCIICNIPKSKPKPNVSRNNSTNSTQSSNGAWGDTDDIDMNNNIKKRPPISTDIKPIRERTLHGEEYTECWLCTNCFAMNRLLDTISKYNYKCAFCHQNTYTPQTEIIKSFEWDRQLQPINNNSNKINKKTQKYLLEEYERKQRQKYNFSGLNNHEGDILIMGMIHQNNVKQLFTIHIIPEDIIRLTLLFNGEFEYDGWDTFTNCNEFEIDNGLTTVCRTDKDKNLWRNCFGMRKVKNVNIENGNGNNNCNNNKFRNNNNLRRNLNEIKNVRFEWILKCVKRMNKDWEDEPVDSVIIGIIESKGIQQNMGSQFSAYNDGWGIMGDGQKVHDGKYEKFNSGFCHMTNINIQLQFVNQTMFDGAIKSKCQVLFDQKIAYELSPEKIYKLAVAMNTKEYQLEWVSFTKYNDVIEVDENNNNNNNKK